MDVVYILVVFFVTVLFLSLPLFPFWKVARRVRRHHPDIWLAKGPFDHNMLIYSTLGSLIDFVEHADEDKDLVRKDPELIRWTRVARDVWRMAPRSFLAQVGYFIVFLYFVGFATYMIMGLFR